MPPGLDSLKHIVVLMMENRSFDHILGSLTAVDPRIDGITNQLSNPGAPDEGAFLKPQPLADFRDSETLTLTTAFAAVLFPVVRWEYSQNRAANMQGFR